MKHGRRTFSYIFGPCFYLKPLVLTGFFVCILLLTACSGAPPAELPQVGAPPVEPSLAEPPQTKFEASVTSGEAALMVTFSNMSQNADEFQWDFGDGATRTTSTTEKTVAHEYTKAGTHTVTLKAIKKGEPQQTSTATQTITVDPGPPDTVTLPPIEVAAGETKQLEVVAKDQYGNQLSEVDLVWTLTDEDAGSLTQAGVFSAGEVAGAFGEVEVKVTQGEQVRTVAATVTVTPGPLEQVVIAPSPADIGMEMTQQFVAVGADQYGNRIAGLEFTWSVQNGGGTVAANGLFTAGDGPGDFEDTVQAEATQDGITRAGTASVTVRPDRIAFISDRNDKQRDVYVMDIDGSNVERLTTTSEPEWRCSWSPDGRRVVYDSYHVNHGILVVNDDGSHRLHLIANSQEVAHIQPAWSPDGSKIAFIKGTVVKERIVNTDLYVMDVDGGNVMQLTNTYGNEWLPAWSPDGTRIVYAFRPGLQIRGDIYVINADGRSDPKPLATFDLADETCPVWSHDGTQIAFVFGRSPHIADGRYNIWVMNADGSNMRQLTRTLRKDYTEPSWSHDGSKIVFVSADPATEDYPTRGEIYIMDADGSNITRLTKTRANDRCPSWAPRKSGVQVTEASVIIPNVSTFKARTTREVTAAARKAVVRIKTDLTSGSGFIIDPSGLILTNNHVISGAEEITVYLEDGTSYTGTVQARDLVRDLAIVKIEATDLPFLEMGDLSQGELGQQVVVLGYPLEAESVSVTSGLVSAIEFDSGRNITWVQTDSAINPGNSGGPMLNLRGQVIGVVSAKMVGFGIEGVGFAISVNTVNTYLPELKAGK